MEKAISAADANRQFSTLLRNVREGASFVVTSHGRPVARIVPIEDGDRSVEVSFQRLIDRLEKQKAIESGSWSRDELYEDDP